MTDAGSVDCGCYEKLVDSSESRERHGFTGKSASRARRNRLPRSIQARESLPRQPENQQLVASRRWAVGSEKNQLPTAHCPLLPHSAGGKHAQEGSGRCYCGERPAFFSFSFRELSARSSFCRMASTFASSRLTRSSNCSTCWASGPARRWARSRRSPCRLFRAGGQAPGQVPPSAQPRQAPTGVRQIRRPDSSR